MGQSVPCPSCGQDVEVPRRDIGPGFTVGNFEIIELLGRGGMGEVYRARQKTMSRDIALKILPHSLTREKELVARFLNEVRLAATLEHPHLVTAFTAGEDSGIHFLAMSYVRGASLDRFLVQNGALDERHALGLLRKVAEALRYAWQEHGLIHRDVKPSNILLDHHGEPHLTDLGLSKSLVDAQGLTVSDRIMGTPNYMSPEQAEACSKVDFRADIYSLGATLYHMVTGQIPFAGSSVVETLRKQVAEPLLDPRQFQPATSPACVALLEFMLAKKPENRHGSWDELIADFDRVLAGQMPSKTPLATGESALLRVAFNHVPQRSPRRERRLVVTGDSVSLSAPTISTAAKTSRLPARWVLVTIAVIAVIAAAGGWFWSPRKQAALHSAKPATVSSDVMTPGITNTVSNIVAALIGTWSVRCRGWSGKCEFLSDGKAVQWAYGEAIQGTYTNDAQRLRVTWADKSWDQYLLPIRPNGMTGTNNAGAQVQAIKNMTAISSAPQSSSTSSASTNEWTTLSNSWRVGKAANLGSTVNSTLGDVSPCVSADGLSLFFASARPGGQGKWDIWMCRRRNTREGWGAPANIGPPVNSASSDSNPSLSEDGSILVFESDRPGGQGYRDIWMSTRQSTAAPWNTPTNLGPVVNSNQHDGGPRVSSDGLALVFHSKRPGGVGWNDLWMCTRSSTSEPWSVAVNAGPPLNSETDDTCPCFSADGLTLLFCSSRLSKQGTVDIWMCSRRTKTAQFDEPVSLGAALNSAPMSAWPALSSDSRTLYFGSTRPGGCGSEDLWQAPVRPPFRLLSSDAASNVVIASQVSGREWIVLPWSAAPGKRTDLWLLSPDGRDRINITSNQTGDSIEPKFSPDGRRIAFTHNNDTPDRMGVYVCNADGGSRQLVIEATRVSRPEWYSACPLWLSNTVIAYNRRVGNTYDSELWRVDLDSGQESRVLSYLDSVGQGSGFATDIIPQGLRVAFAVKPSNMWLRTDVYTIGLDGKGLETVYEDPGDDHVDVCPMFSPSGSSVVWCHSFGSGTDCRYGLAIARHMSGGRWETRMQPEQGDYFIPLAWSPSGTTFLCALANQMSGQGGGSAELRLLDEELHPLQTICKLENWSKTAGVTGGRRADWAKVVPTPDGTVVFAARSNGVVNAELPVESRR